MVGVETSYSDLGPSVLTNGCYSHCNLYNSIVWVSRREWRNLTESIHALDRSLQAVTGRLDRLPQPDKSPSRFSRVALVITAVAAALASVVLYFSVLAFVEPDASSDAPLERPNSITLMLKHPDAPAVSVSVQTYSPFIEYTLYFPKTTAGDTWILFLRGSAVLQKADTFDRKDIRVNKPSCQPTCSQTIIGTVRNERLDASEISGGECSALPRSSNIADIVRIFGKAAATTYHNWAFASQELPYIISTEGPAIAQAGPYYKSNLVGCETLDAPLGFKTISVAPSPERTNGSKVAWVISPDFQPRGIDRRTYALALANFGLILAGLLYAVAAGFFPIWLQSRFTARQ